MELLEGEDLGQRLVRLGPLTAEDAVLYLSHTALALDRTHRAGIVHRDLKACNLFLTQREDGTLIVKVLDFGVAKVMPLEATSEGHTQTVGTPIYMAPEQFRAEGRVSPATDIYALGMLAYTLLVGVHYWKEEHDRCANPFAFASIAVHGPGEPPTIRADRQGITLPEAFDDWFASATSRQPADRFRNASEAVMTLAEALGVAQPVMSSPTNGVPQRDPMTPISSRLGGMPETIESPSARIPGGLTRSTGSGPLITVHSDAELSSIPGSMDDSQAPERTEVSLSVTSGGLDRSSTPEVEPRRSPRWGVITVSVAAVVLVGIGLRGQWQRMNTEPQPVTAETGEPQAAKPKATTEPSEAIKLESLKPPEPLIKVTTIDELPAAPEDSIAEPSPARPAAKRSPSKQRRSSATPADESPAKDREESPPEAKETAGSLMREATPKKAPPAASARQSLYGRD
jgi:serine/threonine-protein kinase